MVLHNDLRYTAPKYTALADSLRMEYKDLWTKDCVLRQWSSTRNYIERMGRNLFTHAGLSLPVIRAGLDMAQINKTMHDYALAGWDTRFGNPNAELLFLTNGALWYRGMVEPDDTD